MKAFLAPVFLFAAAAACSLSSAQTPTGSAPQPGQIIYLPQMPTAESLTSSAQSQGMTIASIRQTANEEVVTYHFANGPDSVVAYRVLPSGTATAPAGQSMAYAPAATSGATYTTAAAPATTVVYSTAAPAYYYGYSGYPAYYGYAGYPWGYYGGIGIGIGGWGWGGRGWGGYGGYRGGYGFGGGFGHGGHR